MQRARLDAVWSAEARQLFPVIEVLRGCAGVSRLDLTLVSVSINCMALNVEPERPHLQ